MEEADMKLPKTADLLKQKINEKEFDSYAIYVFKDNNGCFLHSENVNEDTYFDIASMGKILVTSTLILKAIDTNKLSLVDTLGAFFENVPQDKKNITIKQLLTHTSGIVRCPILPENVAKGKAAIAEQIIDNPLAFAPGRSHTYSCNGMILLGYIIEKIHGMTLEEVFEAEIKKPLGYTRSKFNIALDEPNAAICYRSENVDGLAHPWDDENIRVLQTSAGSGGQFFTISDIIKFADAVINKSEILYSKKIYEMAEKNYVDETCDGQGLGWFYVDEKYFQRGKLFPVGSFGHTGYTGASMFFNREMNMYVIMLTNATRFSCMKNNFKEPDYDGDTCRIRTELHNAIYEDLKEQGVICNEQTI